jgi:hypothetical protein
MKYRKKPVVIEAFQMTPDRRWDKTGWPAWLNEACEIGHGSAGGVFPANQHFIDAMDELAIWTLEGIHLVSFGDFIIRGVQGELYPCKPDIFEQTYEPAYIEGEQP